MEWAKRSGIHLHVVVRDVPGLTVEWIDAVLARRYPAINVHEQEVYSGHGLTRYLTKSLGSLGRQDWGRYSHPTSQSRGWFPRSVQAQADQ
jgi:hypothetical protein